MSFLVMSITIGFMVIVQSAIPFLVNRNTAFGVTIPEGYTEDSTVQNYRRVYTFFMLSAGIVLLTAYSIWTFSNIVSEEQIVMTGLIIFFGLLFLNMIMYLIFHRKTTTRKQKEHWGDGLKQLRIVDLSSRLKDEMLPNLLFSIPMIVTAFLIGYTVSHYNTMPEQIPYHWGVNGQPDSFTSKSPFSVIAVPLLLVIIQGMLLSINVYIKQSGIKLNAAKSKSSQIQRLASRKYTSWLLLFISILLTANFTFMQLTTIHENLITPFVMSLVSFVFLGAILLTTTIFAFKVGQNGSRVRALIEDETSEGITDVDEDRFWKAGVFYVNRNDPSVFVEKRFGIGWTINFGRPISYIIFFVPLLLIIGISVFL